MRFLIKDGVELSVRIMVVLRQLSELLALPLFCESSKPVDPGSYDKELEEVEEYQARYDSQAPTSQTGRAVKHKQNQNYQAGKVREVEESKFC